MINSSVAISTQESSAVPEQTQPSSPLRVIPICNEANQPELLLDILDSSSILGRAIEVRISQNPLQETEVHLLTEFAEGRNRFVFPLENRPRRFFVSASAGRLSGGS